MPGAPGAASAPTIMANASSSEAPLLRKTTATSASANKVNRSTSVDIAAIDGRRTLRSELNTYTGHGEASGVDTNGRHDPDLLPDVEVPETQM